jgi:hypothetical protein
MMSDDSGYDESMELILLAETDNYAVLLGEDRDGEEVYNIELGSVTLHLFEEEWEELVELIKAAAQHK